MSCKELVDLITSKAMAPYPLKLDAHSNVSPSRFSNRYLKSSRHAVLTLTLSAFATICLASSCGMTSAVQCEGSSGMSPFLDALRFLPPGHESYIFDSTSAHLFDRTSCNPEGFPALTKVGKWDFDLPPLRASAGSDFRSPTSSWGRGRYAGIDVIDLRTELSSQAEAAWLNEQGEGLVAATVSGCKVYWSRRFETDPLDSLVTIIDRRFIVVASSLSEMERALERANSLEQFIHAFPPLAMVPQDAECIVCRQPMPDPSGKTPRFEVDQLSVITLRIDPPGWRVYFRERLTEERSTFEFLGADITKQMKVPIDGWKSMVGIPDDPRYLANWMYREAVFGVVGILGALSK